MSYTVSAAPNIGTQGLTVTGLIQLMSSQHPPATVSLQSLGNPHNHHDLTPHQGHAITQGENPEVVRSIGLVSCASVCYVNNANPPIGYVFHANAGSLSASNFQAATTALGALAPYNTVYIAYAHPDASDHGYQQNVAALVGWGIPTNNIVEITHLAVYNFGLNNVLQLGY